ncbi:MAG: phenylalanine--tRNA ligase subunit beta [Bacteriovoracaceae bacterium]|nr:phenylalanine--tRNA ligase subunit beta [Bacteriovoracaceae bacterium]
MKLSYKVFLDWVDFSGGAKDLANVLADLGFPNDGITAVGGGLDQVVVGKVLTKTKHPEADRLNLLTVDIGSEQLPIVCGAHNMKVGDFVALAPIGATIPGKDGQGMAMKEAKIRGQTSKGMCCSLVELQLANESEGILILPSEKISDKDLGRKVSELFDWQDWILEVDITPNRGDALCVRGLAREVAAKLGLKMKTLNTIKWKNPVSTVNPFIESFSDASGFAACLVNGVKFGETPEKWQNFLKSFGARSISNLVDITNIVMFELGHPLHFFDADKVDAQTIGVRRARPGETLVLLNDTVLELHPDDLVIADATGPLSLAGVMGGAKSSISETTKNILIEVASFNPASIRATTRRHQIFSESSVRFEKGLTIFHLDEVIERALALLKELSDFEIAAGTKIVDKQIQPKQILWDRGRIEAKLGKIGKTDDELFEFLRRLEYSFEPKGSTVAVNFPWYRTDVQHLEDVMEDIGRLLGYENLEKKPLVSFESKKFWKDLTPELKLSDQILDSFISFGFSEAIHLSFSSPALEKKLGYEGDDFVVVENPIHSEKSVLRRSILPGLLARAKENAFNGEDEIRLVEVGPIYSASGETIFEESPKAERLSIACVWLPRPQDKKHLWNPNTDPFFIFKGMMESIWSPFKMRPARNLQIPAFYPKRILNHPHGFAGELHPTVLKAMDLSGRAFVGEWLIQGRLADERYEFPFIYPSIDMDASFVAGENLSVGAMMECFQKTKAPYLEWVRPYDIFQSEDLKPKKKSMTFAMRYRNLERTLTLEEAKNSHEQLIASVLKTFQPFEIALR